MKLNIDPELVKGFLDPQEGSCLYELALEVSEIGPCLEIGSYCGKSTLYIAQACLEKNNILFAVDHHRGSEEHQPGEEYHDADLFDPRLKLMDSFTTFRMTLHRAGLDGVVVPIVAASEMTARYWNSKLGMVFIDGGHSIEAAMTDYRCWAPWIERGGYLAIHDIFTDPAEGGQAPHEIYKLALGSGLFRRTSLTLSLGVLQRI